MAAQLKRALLIVLSVFFLGSCQTTPNYHLIYPSTVPAGVTTWQQEIIKDGLLLNFSWARPAGVGPFATVMVHPHGGKTVKEMEGVTWDLARQGYLAVAVDYKRLLDGEFKRNTFVWKTVADSTRALNIISQSKWVDPERIAALGFSQGAMLSLIIAAHAPGQLKTVVAYYPVADFINWFEKPRGFMEGIVFRFIRSHFYDESRAKTEQEFEALLKKASPLRHVQDINVPVLLIHGDADTAARYDESQKLYNKFKALNKEAELIIVPDAVHIFNFRQEPQATFAWNKTLVWLKKYLRN